MQKISLFARLLTLSLAGGVSTHAAAEDWTGSYAGISMGTLLDSRVFLDGEATNNAVEADLILGAFYGYQMQQGQVVYGAEVELGTINDGAVVDGDDRQARDFSLVDLKARVGYDLGETLVYGLLGATRLQADGDFEGEDTARGFSFGVGADYRITQNVTVGAELLARRASLEEGGLTTDFNTETLSLRASFHF